MLIKNFKIGLMFIVGMFFFCVTSYAQIQKNFLGIRLGNTSYNGVKEIFPDAKGNWAGNTDIAEYPGSDLDGTIVEGEPALNTGKVKFAGIEWDFANISFFRGLVCEVKFYSNYSDSETTKASYKKLCKALSDKYGSYKKSHHDKSFNDVSYEIYSDGITRIVTTNVANYFYTLSYQNINLFNKKFSDKIDTSEL